MCTWRRAGPLGRTSARYCEHGERRFRCFAEPQHAVGTRRASLPRVMSRPPASPPPGATATAVATAVVLAAGESTRMRSSRPKVLHPLCGRPLIDYPARACRALGLRLVLVVGRGADDVRAAVGEAHDLTYVEQKERLGTGHALMQARGACPEDGAPLLVMPGDVPLLSADTLRPAPRPSPDHRGRRDRADGRGGRPGRLRPRGAGR